MLAAIPLPEFVPKKVRIKAEEDEKVEEGGEDDGDAVKTACQKLVNIPPEELATMSVHPISFEKVRGCRTVVLAERALSVDSATDRPSLCVPQDDVTNYHIAYIAAAANMRARNYSIKECSNHQAKMIAGKIIPAIATTTAMVRTHPQTCIDHSVLPWCVRLTLDPLEMKPDHRPCLRRVVQGGSRGATGEAA